MFWIFVVKVLLSSTFPIVQFIDRAKGWRGWLESDKIRTYVWLVEESTIHRRALSSHILHCGPSLWTKTVNLRNSPVTFS